MSRFDDYSTRYSGIAMRREDGILELRVHTDNGPMRWGRLPHKELEDAFLEVARDQDNEVVIFTGTGGEFSGPALKLGEHRAIGSMTPAEWDDVLFTGKRLITNLLSIEVPMIAAINGPAPRHAELPLLCDIVLACDTASFQDSAHFNAGLVPGDGVHVVFPALMGINRGRYFLLTGQVLSAAEAKELGLVSEVLPGDQLLARAWALARQIAARPRLVRRYSRLLLTQDLRKRMDELLGYGLALEGLAACDLPSHAKPA